jgi:hypothetical protein
MDEVKRPRTSFLFSGFSRHAPLQLEKLRMMTQRATQFDAPFGGLANQKFH